MQEEGKKLVLFFGPPGSGKGALSQMFVEKFGWLQLSTGNLCRKHCKEGTDIGQQINIAIKSGKLVSDQLIINMVMDYLKNDTNGCQAVILDGFPRTVFQAEEFVDLLKIYYSKFTIFFIKLLITREELVARVLTRRTCSNKSCQSVYSEREESCMPLVPGICDKCGNKLFQRDDDAIDSISGRLDIYYEHENKLLNFYKNTGQKIYNVNSQDTIENVFKNIEKIIGGECDID